MNERGVDALLIFRQESMYYLTGYDTAGYTMFQCLVLLADGDMVLVTRSADREQAAYTSVIPDVRIWVDRGGRIRPTMSSPSSRRRNCVDAGLAWN